MSEEQIVPTSPEDAKTRDAGRVNSLKDFSGALTMDLSDAEIKRAFELVITTKNKWQEIFRAKFPFDSIEAAMDLVGQFEDEVKTRLAEELSLLVTVDVMPVLEGREIEIVFMGAFPGHSVNKYGFDHERKEYEVKKATTLGEDAVLGQKNLKI